MSVPTTPAPGLTREQRAHARGECPTRGHCVLRAEELHKSFHRGIWPRRRTMQVLTGASLEVCAGELVGLVSTLWMSIPTRRSI